MIKEYHESEFEYCEVLDFLKRMDCHFDPPISKRLLTRSTVCSIDDYLKKVISSGNLLIYSSGSGMVEGVVVLYANDMINRAAYIPMLAVDEKYCGRGIATALVRAAVKLAKTEEMETLTVKTWASNKAARRIYAKIGFLEKQINNTEIVFEIYI